MEAVCQICQAAEDGEDLRQGGGCTCVNADCSLLVASPSPSATPLHGENLRGAACSLHILRAPRHIRNIFSFLFFCVFLLSLLYPPSIHTHICDTTTQRSLRSCLLASLFSLLSQGCRYLIYASPSCFRFAFLLSNRCYRYNSLSRPLSARALYRSTV